MKLKIDHFFSDKLNASERKMMSRLSSCVLARITKEKAGKIFSGALLRELHSQQNIAQEQ
jgi:hypothetical protein